MNYKKRLKTKQQLLSTKKWTINDDTLIYNINLLDEWFNIVINHDMMQFLGTEVTILGKKYNPFFKMETYDIAEDGNQYNYIDCMFCDYEDRKIDFL